MLGEPVVEEFFEVGVERDVAVVVEFSDWGSEPVRGADLDDGVDGESEEFPASHPGSGEHFDGEPVERVGEVAGGGQEFRGCWVVEESGQRPVLDWDVAGEDWVAAWRVIVFPVDDPAEESAEVPEAHPDGRRAEVLAPLLSGSGCEPWFECFDVDPTDVGGAGDVGVPIGDEPGEHAEGGVDRFDAARPQ